MQGNLPILVTGGSQGIGTATVRLAVERGYPVVFTYRSNGAQADRLVEELHGGPSVKAVRCDIGEREDIDRLFDAIDRDFGGLAALVNNAATQASVNSSLIDAAMDDVSRLIDVNLTGVIAISRLAAMRMAKSRGGAGGSIVMVSSVAARLGAPNVQIWYGASKGGVDALTIGLARELAAEGIRVNAVSPGPTLTNDRPEQLQRLQALASTIPMGRLGRPEEIAYPILWLISDEASFVTGANLTVSGGR